MFPNKPKGGKNVRGNSNSGHGVRGGHRVNYGPRNNLNGTATSGHYSHVNKVEVGSNSSSHSNLSEIDSHHKKNEIDGIYKNSHILYTVTSLIGCLVRVTALDGKVYEGILKTFSSEFELALLSVVEVMNNNNKTENEVKSKNFINNIQNILAFLENKQAPIDMVVMLKDLVKLEVADADLDYAAVTKKSVLTDGEISKVDPKNHNQERELVPWNDGDGDELGTALGTGFSNNGGWNANDMLEYNQKKYNINSTFDDNLTGYTIPLEKRDDEEFKKVQAQAEAIAREIEGDVDRNRRLALENELDEETRFSAVVSGGKRDQELGLQIKEGRDERRNMQKGSGGGIGGKGQNNRNNRNQGPLRSEGNWREEILNRHQHQQNQHGGNYTNYASKGNGGDSRSGSGNYANQAKYTNNGQHGSGGQQTQHSYPPQTMPPSAQQSQAQSQPVQSTQQPAQVKSYAGAALGSKNVPQQQSQTTASQPQQSQTVLASQQPPSHQEQHSQQNSNSYDQHYDRNRNVPKRTPPPTNYNDDGRRPPHRHDSFNKHNNNNNSSNSREALILRPREPSDYQLRKATTPPHKNEDRKTPPHEKNAGQKQQHQQRHQQQQQPQHQQQQQPQHQQQQQPQHQQQQQPQHQQQQQQPQHQQQQPQHQQQQQPQHQQQQQPQHQQQQQPQHQQQQQPQHQQQQQPQHQQQQQPQHQQQQQPQHQQQQPQHQQQQPQHQQQPPQHQQQQSQQHQQQQSQQHQQQQSQQHQQQQSQQQQQQQSQQQQQHAQSQPQNDDVQKQSKDRQEQKKDVKLNKSDAEMKDLSTSMSMAQKVQPEKSPESAAPSNSSEPASSVSSSSSGATSKLNPNAKSFTPRAYSAVQPAPISGQPVLQPAPMVQQQMPTVSQYPYQQIPGTGFIQIPPISLQAARHLSQNLVPPYASPYANPLMTPQYMPQIGPNNVLVYNPNVPPQQMAPPNTNVVAAQQVQQGHHIGQQGQASQQGNQGQRFRGKGLNQGQQQYMPRGQQGQQVPQQQHVDAYQASQQVVNVTGTPIQMTGPPQGYQAPAPGQVVGPVAHHPHQQMGAVPVSQQPFATYAFPPQVRFNVPLQHPGTLNLPGPVYDPAQMTMMLQCDPAAMAAMGVQMAPPQSGQPPQQIPQGGQPGGPGIQHQAPNTAQPPQQAY